MKKIPSKEELINAYYHKDMTQQECCNYFGIKSPITFRKWLDVRGIPGKNVNKLNSLEYKLGLDEEQMAEKIRSMYWDEQKSINKIADELGITHTVISRRMEKYNIEKLPIEDAKTIFGSGEKSGTWKGGINHTSHGYIMVKDKEHPFADPRGYVYQHRLVIEKEMGRYLTTKEVVHHINGNKKDNSLKNLMVMSHTDHMILHGQLRRGEVEL